MEISQFERLVYQGRGQAILHLQTHDPAPYQAIIFDACLHNIVWDPQSNGGRFEYLAELARLAGNESEIREAVLSALETKSDSENEHDIYQWFDLARLWAKQGDEIARKAIYAGWLARLTPTNAIATYKIFDLDGIEGFLFIAEHIGEFLRAGHQWSEDDLYSLELAVGQEQADEFLCSSPHLSPNVKAYLKHLKKRDQQVQARPKRKRKRINSQDYDYRYMKLWIMSPHEPYTSPPISFEAWGKEANEADLLLAAKDLLRLGKDDDHTDELLQYLWIFAQRAFPLEPMKLIDMFNYWMPKTTPLLDENDWLRRPGWLIIRILAVLQNINHPDVRQFALQLIDSPHWIGKGRAVALLANSLEPEDWQLIEVISRLPLDNEDYHHLGFSVRDVFYEHPLTEAVPIFINLYERGPCSMCRWRDVRCLHSIDQVPDWMAEECQYDAYPYLRKWAKEGFPAREH